ncbi:MAG: DUF6582 domain-containing protein [Acidobacteriaceae bacterium]
MAKLTSAARKAVPTKSFAEPDKRKYPIENEAHARNALARVAQSGTPAEKAKVKAAVKKKYPSIGKKGK